MINKKLKSELKKRLYKFVLKPIKFGKKMIFAFLYVVLLFNLLYLI